MPLESKVVSFWKTIRTKSLTKALLELKPTPTAMQNFADSNRETANMDLDQPFVAGFQMQLNGAKATFQLVITTLRLLNFSPDYVNFVHADDTHNTVWFDCPLILLGGTDKARTFHPYLVALCSGATIKDYQFVYATYKKYRPNQVMLKYVLCDGAEAVFNGIVAAHGRNVTLERLMCWMHVFIKNFLKAVDKISYADIASIPDVTARSEAIKARKDLVHYLVEHTKCLHQCSSEQQFDVAVRLWWTMYVGIAPRPPTPPTPPERNVVRDITIKFYNTYLAPGARLRRFYAGAARGQNMNNCGGEKHNDVLKAETGVKSALNVMTAGLFKYLQAQSLKRIANDVNAEVWATDPTIPESMWVKANHISMNNEQAMDKSAYKIVKQGGHSKVAFMVVWRKYHPTFFSGSDEHRAAIVASAFERLANNSWSSISDFHKFICGEFLVVKDPDLGWHCHCETRTRDHVCEHELAVRLHLKEVTVPITAMSFTGTHIRGRGRSRKNDKRGTFREDPTAAGISATRVATEQANLAATQSSLFVTQQRELILGVDTRTLEYRADPLTLPLPRHYNMMPDGGCFFNAILAYDRNSHPTVEESMDLYEALVLYMTERPNDLIPTLIGGETYTLKEYVDFMLTGKEVNFDHPDDGQILLDDQDFDALVKLMGQRNSSGGPRCWPELCYVGFAASTCFQKNIHVYDDNGGILEAYWPTSGPSMHTVHLRYDGVNHFDFFDVRGTYDDTVYQKLRAAKLAASERANQVAAAEVASLRNDKGTDDRRSPRPQRLRKALRLDL